jgi:arginase
MHIRLLLVPYSLGQDENRGAGASPLRYVQVGIEQAFSESGLTVTVERIQQDEPHSDPRSASIAANKKLAQAVQQTLLAGDFPLIVSGSCDVSLGILAGFDHSHTGVIWFDAHGDFNTPETTRGGFFGGMPLAIVTGHCYQDLWTHIGNSIPYLKRKR